MNKIGIIGASLDLGAGKRGTNMGPVAIREAGVNKRLMALGYEINDFGDIEVKQSIIEKHPNPKLKYLDEILESNTLLANSVDRIIEDGYFPLILGGDHSISIGSLAGVAKHKKNLGLIWYDAHGDMNTDQTTPSGNIHGMPLAVHLGLGNQSLTQIGNYTPKVKPEHVVIIGARDLDLQERELIRQTGIKVYTMHEIDRMGMATVMEEALQIVTTGTDGLHLSLDLDGLDPLYAPGVGTPVIGGLTYRESHLAMEMIAESGALTSCEFVEVNPILDRENITAKTAVGLIGSLFGEKLL